MFGKNDKYVFSREKNQMLKYMYIVHCEFTKHINKLKGLFLPKTRLNADFKDF